MQENERSGEDAGGGQEWNPPDAHMWRISEFEVSLLTMNRKATELGCDDLSTACGSAILSVRLTPGPDQSLACRTIYLTLLACQNTHSRRHWLVPA